MERLAANNGRDVESNITRTCPKGQPSQIATLLQSAVNAHVEGLGKSLNNISLHDSMIQPYPANVLKDLALAYYSDYEQTGDRTKLDSWNEMVLDLAKETLDNASDRLKLLRTLTEGTFAIWGKTKDISDLKMHSGLLEDILRERLDDSERSKWLGNLASAQKQEYNLTGDVLTLDKAIKNGQASLALSPSDHPSKLDRLITLLRMQLKGFTVKDETEQEGFEETLKPWIANCHSALEIVPEDHHTLRQELMQMLGQGYSWLAFETMDLKMIDESLRILEDVLASIPKDDAFCLQGLYRLGLGYGLKSELTGDGKHLDTGTEHIEAAADLVPEGDRDRADLFRLAASMQHDLYTRCHELRSLERSILLYGNAIRALPDGDLEKIKMSGIVAGLSTEKEERLKNSAGENALLRLFPELRGRVPESFLEKEYQGTARGHARLLAQAETKIKENLGSELSLFCQDCDPDLLQHFNEVLGHLAEEVYAGSPPQNRSQTEHEVHEGERLLKKVPMTGIQRQILLISIGSKYVNLYNGGSLSRYLDQAIHCFREVINTDQGDDKLAQHGLSYLQGALWMKYEATQEDDDLDIALEESCTTLDLPLAGGKHRVISLFAIGNGLRQRYRKRYSEADLNLWVSVYQRALVASPAGSSLRPLALLRTGEAFDQRYQRRGALKDLEIGIQYTKEALELLAPDDSERVEALFRLSHSYLDRFLRNPIPDKNAPAAGSEEDVILAAKTAEIAINAPTASSTQKGMVHLLLSNIHLVRYKYLGREEADGDNAYHNLIMAEEAMIWTQDEARDEVLTNLGEDFMDQRSNGPTRNWDLEAKTLRLSLENVEKEDDVRLAGILNSIGRHHHGRYKVTGDSMYLQLAIEHLDRALSHIYSPTLQRIPAGLLLFAIQADLQDWHMALVTASTLVSLVSSVISYSLETSDKQSIITSLASLGTDTAAVAILAGESPASALQLLESSRGILLSSLVSIRSDVTDLQAKYPEIAQEYIKARNQLDIAAPAGTQLQRFALLPEQQPGFRYNAAKRLEEVVTTIRELPGYSSFLQAPSIKDITAAAAEGPIVVVNASKYGCHAFIIEEKGIGSLVLQNISYKDIAAREKDLVEPSLTPGVLEWLWEGIADPVFNILGLTQSCQGVWPRICWIPTGPLAKFPLHAAGYHLSSTEAVLDRVISSYSPSLTALVQSRINSEMKNTAAGKPKQAVMIGMKELPCAQPEIMQVAEICKTIRVKLPPPRFKDVLESLRGCDIFHFAGHALSNPHNPSHSSLVLSHGDRLKVADLLDLNLHRQEARPFLAFLSACRTAQVKDDKLIDEGLHLIGACQVAGFRHVIGTLWDANDEACMKVAIMVYDWMQSHRMDDKSVSEGLHQAIRELRRSWIKSEDERRLETFKRDENASRDIELAEVKPLLWIPFVHYGIL